MDGFVFSQVAGDACADAAGSTRRAGIDIPSGGKGFAEVFWSCERDCFRNAKYQDVCAGLRGKGGDILSLKQKITGTKHRESVQER